jgi:hypothetical protein
MYRKMSADVSVDIVDNVADVCEENCKKQVIDVFEIFLLKMILFALKVLCILFFLTKVRD